MMDSAGRAANARLGDRSPVNGNTGGPAGPAGVDDSPDPDGAALPPALPDFADPEQAASSNAAATSEAAATERAAGGRRIGTRHRRSPRGVVVHWVRIQVASHRRAWAAAQLRVTGAGRLICAANIAHTGQSGLPCSG
ncbi:MAG: hypothetical protein ABJC62_01330 [Frankiaceae bacterium]